MTAKLVTSLFSSSNIQDQLLVRQILLILWVLQTVLKTKVLAINVFSIDFARITVNFQNVLCSNCKTLCQSIFQGQIALYSPCRRRRRRLSRFVTINSTSIEPSMKVRNLTSVHHIIPSESSVHHQFIISA